MSLLRTVFITVFAFFPAGAALAGSGFYGFTEGTPLSAKEYNPGLSSAPRHIINYRQKMRDTANMLTDYARKQNPQFKILAHEGRDLLEISLDEASLNGYNEARKHSPNAEDATFLQHDYQGESTPETLRYLNSLDGIVFNSLFCGKHQKNKIPDILQKKRLKIAAAEYCPKTDELDEALQDSVGMNVLLYAFTNKNNAFSNVENQIIINENAKNIFEVSQAQNILLLTNDSQYPSKEDFIKKLRDSNFDIIVIPALFHEHQHYTKDEVHSLKFKKNGTTRLILAEVNLSEAAEEQYFWNEKWNKNPPKWFKRKSFTKNNAQIAEYWHPEWQKILSAYMKGVVDSGFDGAFYTGLDNYRYFDTQTPLD